MNLKYILLKSSFGGKEKINDRTNQKGLLSFSNLLVINLLVHYTKLLSCTKQETTVWKIGFLGFSGKMGGCGGDWRDARYAITTATYFLQSKRHLQGKVFYLAPPIFLYNFFFLKFLGLFYWMKNKWQLLVVYRGEVREVKRLSEPTWCGCFVRLGVTDQLGLEYFTG